jgi:hypothetical protein
MLRTMLLAAMLAVAAQPVRAQPTPSSSIRAGTYDLEIVFGGGTLEGKLEIRTSGDSLVAKMNVGDHESPIRAGERKGNRLALVSASPGVQLHYDLEFSGDAVKGTFTYDGQSGSVSGKRRPAGS